MSQHHCKLRGTTTTKNGEFGLYEGRHHGCDKQCFDCMADVGDKMIADKEKEWKQQPPPDDSDNYKSFPTFYPGGIDLGKSRSIPSMYFNDSPTAGPSGYTDYLDSLRAAMRASMAMDTERIWKRAITPPKPKTRWEKFWAFIKPAYL